MRPDDLRRVVVAGGGVAGLAAADTLRRKGFDGSIDVLAAEPHRPYDRPPLSKQVLSSGWDLDRITLRVSPELAARVAVWHLGDPAAALDVGSRHVVTRDGRTLSWDGLVIATGSRPRRLPFGHEFPNTVVLRTIDDALALRSALAAARHVTVIGAGFLGCEVAAAARAADVEVDLVDTLGAPMARHLGPLVSGRLALLHQQHGVSLRMGVGVSAIEGRDRAERVLLDDGSVVETDLVVVAVGSQPDVGWLAGSGLPVDDGVVCDSALRVAPGVVAAGDVASWFNPEFGTRMRVEHRTNAGEQGAAAAASLLGGAEPYSAVPYFWSHQWDVRINAYGHFAAAESLEVVAGSVEEGRFAAVLDAGDGGPVAGLTWNMPQQGAAVRASVLEGCAARRSALLPT